MAKLDPRITPARPDLAASQLRGTVDAPRYVDGTLQDVVVAQAPLRNGPTHGSTLLTEAVMGERITIYDTDEDGWAWGQLAGDGYVGFVPAAALLAAGPAPTHKVAALRTLAFPGASIKLPPMDMPPFGATVAVVRTAGNFAVTATGAFIPARHLVPLDRFESDFVAVAERFLGTPYLWGGKTNMGLDCSGLVQVSLTACGVTCPRDSDMQETALGTAGALTGLRRGDLVFWKGHVAIARDAATLIHANAHHMAVAIESAGEALSRIKAAGSEVTSIRRIG